MASVGAEEPLIIAHVERGGFVDVKRGARLRAGRPAPGPATLGDCMRHLRGCNSFAVLTEKPEPDLPADSFGPAFRNYR